MDNSYYNNDKIPRTTFMVLLSFAGALVALFVIGTIFGLVRPAGSPPILRLGRSRPQEIQRPIQTGDIQVFTGLSRLRIPLSNSSVMVLSIAFPYPSNDFAFMEELAGKINDLGDISNDYFSSLPQTALIQIDEETAKREILRRFNSILRLGSISDLYFTDLTILTNHF